MKGSDSKEEEEKSKTVSQLLLVLKSFSVIFSRS
jgi:hypothetical protein